jgi:hypothetical protein
MGNKVFKDMGSNKHWTAKDKELKGCLLAIRNSEGEKVFVSHVSVFYFIQ